MVRGCRYKSFGFAERDIGSERFGHEGEAALLAGLTVSDEQL